MSVSVPWGRCCSSVCKPCAATMPNLAAGGIARVDRCDETLELGGSGWVALPVATDDRDTAVGQVVGVVAASARGILPEVCAGVWIGG